MTRDEINTYNRNAYAKDPVKFLKRNRASYLRNKDKRNASTRKWVKDHPWFYHYSGARSRCKPDAKYGKRGILFTLTCEQVKEIWFRDKAYLLKQPSIDRIETSGHYTFDNIQFIELKENMLKPKSFPPGWRIYKKKGVK